MLRPKTDASYEYICSYIEAAYITATSDDVKTLIERLVSDMNQVIIDFKGSHKSSLSQKKAAKEPKEPKEPKQPKDPKQPEKPKDPKQPEKPGGGSGEQPKKPDEKPKDPKKPDDGNPDITLPEE